MKKERLKKEHDEIKLIFEKLKPLKEQIGKEAYELIKKKIVGFFVYKEAFDLLIKYPGYIGQPIIFCKSAPSKKGKENARDS